MKQTKPKKEGSSSSSPSQNSYTEKCKSILAISDKIRFAAFLDNFGKTRGGALSKNTKPLLSSIDARNEFFLIATIMSMRSNHYAKLGSLDYALLEHEKVTLILLQEKNGVYYISIEKSVPQSKRKTILEKSKNIVYT